MGVLAEQLASHLSASGALIGFWDVLDEHKDAQLGVSASARPMLVAARFASHPQCSLVIVAGKDASVSFARQLKAFVGDDKVLHYPERSDLPFRQTKANKSDISRRMRAQWALINKEKVIVVASASSLIRYLPPALSLACAPLVLETGLDLGQMKQSASHLEMKTLDDLCACLVSLGYENTAHLDGPGTFCTRGGTVDVFPGNSAFPIRLDFFGDTLDEIRRVVSSLGQTISSLDKVEIYPVSDFPINEQNMMKARAGLALQSELNPALRELYDLARTGVAFDGSDTLVSYVYDKTQTLGDYADKGCLVSLVEPKSLIDDAQHAYDEVKEALAGTKFPMERMFCPSTKLSFGNALRATYGSFMMQGVLNDQNLSVKRIDIMGSLEKLHGRLAGLLHMGFKVVFSLPNAQVRHDIEMDLIDKHLPYSECLEFESASKTALEPGVINITDVDFDIGMTMPQAKLALITLHDLRGVSSRMQAKRKVDINNITFAYKPGDYVVHAVHGVAYFKEMVRRQTEGVERDYLLLEYAEGDKLYVPVEQLDRVTRYVGPEGSIPRLTRLSSSDWSTMASGG
ncbi:MAG: hypothetical protein J6Y65_03050 [Eggerthellaceae bacterium]|nr:hypothetical protein [Eggerthellaceae bacterium]